MVVTWKGACVSQPNKKDDTVSLLLVESHAQDVRSIRDLLDHLPDGLVALQHASTLAAGLDLLSGQQVDAILLDLQLPDSQGPDTFYALQPHCPTVPVLLLSDTDDEAVATQTAKQGAQDYLIKEDLTSRSLLRAVRYGIDRHRLAQELAEKNLELRESDQRHRAIIESHADGVVIVDSRGRILFANPSAHELYAAAPGALTGTSFGIPHPSADVGEIAIMLPMGAHRVAEMRVTQTVWHHADVFLVALRDMTARSDSEAAIALYRDHLQELVFRRTEQLSRINDHLNQEIQDHEQTEASLRDAVEKLETHNQMQTDFVSNVSHELKTPLASIEYAVDNLLNGVVGESPERVDDEAMVRALAAEQLTVHGYSVTSCGDAAEALEIMKRMHTDVLVVDIILPGMGGIDLISQIKIDKNLHELPIVAITGAILDAEKQDVLDSFSIPVITKPWQVEDFMTAIENTIAGRDLPKARHRGISA